MQTIPKCLLLPIDGTDESLRPARFLSRLYPPEQVKLILSYFSTPPPPAYTNDFGASREMLVRKWQFFGQLKREERAIFDHALEVLSRQGFSKESIQEYVEPKGMGVSKQACLLGDIRKVDAIVVQKHVRSRLETLMGLDSASALVQQCPECPIWLTDGEIDSKKAALYIIEEEAALRIADHAGYMLADTDVDVLLISPGEKVTHPVSCRPSEALPWLAGHAGELQATCLLRASQILSDYGISEDRLQITLVPHKGHSLTQILSWCASSGIGILGLGRGRPEAILGVSKTSAAAKIASDFHNMAVWVA